MYAASPLALSRRRLCCALPRGTLLSKLVKPKSLRLERALMRMRVERLLLAAGLTIAANAAPATAWIIETVGPGKQFPTISAAVGAQTASNLYEIDVAAGTYQNDFSVITNPTDIEAKGGPVILQATVPPPNE